MKQLQDYSLFDGEIISYDIVTPQNAMNRSPYENTSMFLGLDKKSIAKRQDARSARKDRRIGVKEMKAQTKAETAKSQSETNAAAIKLAGTETESDKSLAKSLSDNLGIGADKEMSKGAKIGIAVGVAVLLGIIGFVVYKKMKKGK